MDGTDPSQAEIAPPPLWVQVHHREIEDTLAEFLQGSTRGKKVLELGCGSGGVAAHRLKDAGLIVGADVSDSALQTAREFFRADARISFERMDPQKLDFPDGNFDIVVAKEVLQRVEHPGQCLAEVRRVLGDGGLFAMSSPNLNSLHLRANRKLGRPDFPCAPDHRREFTYSEMLDLLAEHGFSVIAAEGVTLMPYHAVPGLFPAELRDLEETDPEFNEWLRVLGRRVGPEFAFCYVILASKGPFQSEDLARTHAED